MKKIILYINFSIVTFITFLYSWSLPSDWNDFVIGLVDDNTMTDTLGKAIDMFGIEIDYHYRYINGGIDTNTNWYSWGPTGSGSIVTTFIENGLKYGIRPAWTIYLLQEEGGVDALLKNIDNPDFMREYYRQIAWVADKSKGLKPIFVIEPDTWGYFLKAKFHDDSIKYNEATVHAHVNDLGEGYEYLSDLPNNLQGVARGIIRTIRKYAPDAYVGFHVNTWAVWVGGLISGIYDSDNANGLVYWDSLDIAYSAQINAKFYKSLLGDEDRGDFIVVEKYGLDAGVAGEAYYWGDKEMEKYLYWCSILSDSLDLPLLGWQIPIGHLGLPNTTDSYEDTFMPYFFNHVNDFIKVGFIGILAGQGLPAGTDYSTSPEWGDQGWLFSKLVEFDKGRPYLRALSINKQQATFSISKNINIDIYPNPFNPQTTIYLNNLKLGGKIFVAIYDIKGKLLQRLYKGKINSKDLKLTWNGESFSSGVYFVKVKYNGNDISKKMVLIK